MTIYVLMGNDFPEGAFSSIEKVWERIQEKWPNASGKDGYWEAMGDNHTMYLKAYEFEVDTP